MSPHPTVPTRSAAPQLRRWTPPEVLVLRGAAGDPTTVGSGTAEVLAVALTPATGPATSAGSPGVQVPPASRAVAERYGIDLAAVAVAEKLGGRPGSSRVPVPAPDGAPRRLLALGLGDSGPTDLRRAGAALARAVGDADAATPALDGVGATGVTAFVEGYVLAGYQPPVSGARAADEPARRRLHLLGEVDADAVERALTRAGATVLARDLAATPANLKDPAWMVGQARELAAAAGLDVVVRGEADLRAEGFGGLLAVGGGSPSPPALVQVGWTPPAQDPAATVPHVVLVGKGITYDTGGLALKPRESMVGMKTDMTGAAVVLAVVLAAARSRLPVRVTALLALAENAFGGASYRPGDVVRHHGGRTTEINNTDAEGRLVLGDALAFADATLQPDVLVDVATLTGAVGVALGKRHAALFATDEALGEGLRAAGEASGERLWPLPLVAEYAELLDSELADATQVARTPGAGAGTVLAALFLQPFVGGRRWAHLDIAGTGRSDVAEHEVNRGATGFGARVLLSWLEGLSA
ncbi:M17 family metallopeptidase [Kineococcus gynurae]|uniref:Probable cytosol aminopeptidase n=1 Tax=Kineococcus gynurae TaxID=452979 RepID=A0ABV5LN82_9ACTN